ncbi:MAG: sugar kinase [Planctomycetes bacterium]|nr:sugar kinase [Planctomycetota bacterium]
MPLLVVGSIGIDTIETPHGRAADVLGGAATYFSYAASFFTTVRLVGVVGADFPTEYRQVLESRRIDTSGLEGRVDGKTFRWRGRYSPDMNERQTIEVHLNVLGDFRPQLGAEQRGCPFVFLANGSPTTQLAVLDQMRGPRLAVADTMDLWIETQHDELLRLLGRIDGLVINDQEARLLGGTSNLVRAGRAIQAIGPRFVILKKGEHGAMFFSRDETYVMPAYPTPDVVDPTGAGDTFGGGFMGQIAENGDITPAALKRAMAYGIVTASFTVEDFSLRRLSRISRADIERRIEEYRRMMAF